MRRPRSGWALWSRRRVEHQLLFPACRAKSCEGRGKSQAAEAGGGGNFKWLVSSRLLGGFARQRARSGQTWRRGSGRSECGDPEIHPGVLGLSEPVTEEVSLNLRLVTAHRHRSISRGEGLARLPTTKTPSESSTAKGGPFGRKRPKRFMGCFFENWAS